AITICEWIGDQLDKNDVQELLRRGVIYVDQLLNEEHTELISWDSFRDRFRMWEKSSPEWFHALQGVVSGNRHYNQDAREQWMNRRIEDMPSDEEDGQQSQEDDLTEDDERRTDSQHLTAATGTPMSNQVGANELVIWEDDPDEDEDAEVEIEDQA
ncbi:hypothetical protein BGZ65_011224, partial [Modicella reniformis]